jgi:glycosyltransferase involved in cell wall biosynthesis
MRDLAASPPVRVLHVLGSMARGGIETWLMHVLRRSMPGVEHHLCLTKAEAGPHEAECRALGIPIHRVVWRRDPVRWSLAFRRLLIEAGPFDAVHSHAHLFSGIALPAAWAAGVIRRIAHAHTVRANHAGRGVARRLYEAAMLASVRAAATDGLGISDRTMADMFGPRWRARPRVRKLLYGFDFSAFEDAPARASAVRAGLGLAPEALVLGHVGRFVPFKNHAFLIDMFAAVAAKAPDARLLLVGSGPLEDAVRAQAAALNLTDRVVFAGETDDVAARLAAMDVFVMPSWTEGLGIVLVEAQAAGTPVIMTDTMPSEVDLWPGQVRRLSLAAGPEAWAEAAIQAAQNRPRRAEGLAAVRASPFAIERCLSELQAVYSDGARR